MGRLYHTLQDPVNVVEDEVERMYDPEDGHDTALVFMNSERLWLPAQI